MLRIANEAKTRDSTNSVILMAETFSEYNWYSWSPVEISVGFSQTEFTKQTNYINIQRLRHKKDKMQLYCLSDQQVPIEVRSLKITAHTIKRK